MFQLTPTLREKSCAKPVLRANLWVKFWYSGIGFLGVWGLFLAYKNEITWSVPERTFSHYSRVSSIPSRILDQHSVWSLAYSVDEFTFIDLIKGFVPKDFSLAVGIFINNPNDLKSLLVTFLDSL